MDRRRLAKLNVGQALKLQIDLTNLETRKQRIVESMKIGPPMSFDDERLAQLTAIEQAMAEIKTQLHMGRRRLVKGNVAKQIEKYEKLSKKKYTGPARPKMVQRDANTGPSRRRLVKGNVAKQIEKYEKLSK